MRARLFRRIAQVTCLSLFLPVFFLSSAEALDRRPIDVVELTWRGAAPLVTTQVEIASKINGEVRERWENLTTFTGGFAERRIQFYWDQGLTVPIELLSPLACNRSDFTSFMNAIRIEAYKRLSIESFSDRYLIILMPESNCIWEGRSLIGSAGSRGGTMILQDTSDAFVIAHELGHSLGLGHSNFIRCESAQRDAAWNRCKAVEYGGTVDLMGNVPTSAPLSTYHQWRMGMMNDSQVKEIWNNQTVSLSAVDMRDGIKSLFIRDNRSTYWIEFRRERLESGYKSGLVIYRTDPPPSSSILSPNAEDSYGDGSNLSVTSDMWLINLDNFNYADSRSSGSMTLNLNKSFTAYSGNFTIEVTGISENQNAATLLIKRLADQKAPPKPSIATSGELRSSSDSVLQIGFEDLETYVDSFEIKKNDEIIASSGRPDSTWKQTYLQPFNTSKVLTVADLPEGKYSLSVRTVDIAGNKSDWSNPQMVNIDRGAPKISNKVNVESTAKGMARIRFQEIFDEGSQLCGTSLYNEFDYVLQYSDAKNSPVLDFPIDKDSYSRIQAKDCLGNIRDARIDISLKYFDAVNGSKIGNWKIMKDSTASAQAKCVGRCSVSISTSGQIAFMLNTNQVEILVSGKKFQTPKGRPNQDLTNIDLGPKRKILRITGKDLVFNGFLQVISKISDQKVIDASSQGGDPSLSLANQVRLIGLGFNSNDFVNGWRVLPMAGGTSTSDPTLDLCSSNYKSEKLRSSRRQMVVSRMDTPYAFLSSESVEYSDSQAANLALTELKENFALCKKSGGWTDNSGFFSKYRFLDSSVQETLLGEQDSIVVHAIMGEGANLRTLFAIYQFRDNFFTGLYVVRNGETPFNQVEMNHWTHVGRVFAQRLKQR